MLFKDSTYISPEILIDENKLICAGNFWMEDACQFFEQLYSEVEKYSLNNYVIKFVIDNINSSSLKQLYEFLKKVKLNIDTNNIKGLNIFMYHKIEDKDLKDLLNYFSEMVDYHINVRQLPADTNYNI